MADAWIKVRFSLRRHPKVVQMSSALKADKLRIVGGLVAVWGVFDEHSVDGKLTGYSFDAMDSEIGWPGFSAAMHGIGWLDRDGDCGLVMPRFQTHNGASAKRRATDAERKQDERDRVRDSSASKADVSSSLLEPLGSEIKEARTRATRLPADWILPDELRTWALAEQPTWTEGQVAKVAVSFRDYWIAVPGARGTKLDWAATWRTWVRKEGPMKGVGTNKAEAQLARNREVAERVSRRAESGDA